METKTINQIKKWVMKDAVVKKGNKISCERAIELTIKKIEQMALEEIIDWSYDVA